MLLLRRPPATLLTVGQLPHFEGPQLDLVDDGGVVGDGHVMRVLGGDSMENIMLESVLGLLEPDSEEKNGPQNGPQIQL